MNFTFESRKPKDGQFGSKQKDGSWSGMVGELMDGSVDMGMKFRIHVAFHYENCSVSALVRFIFDNTKYRF